MNLKQNPNLYPIALLTLLSLTTQLYAENPLNIGSTAATLENPTPTNNKNKNKTTPPPKKEKNQGFFLQNFIPKPWQKKLKISLHLRHRLEYQENKDFTDNLEGTDHDAFHLLRTRLNIDFQPIKMFRAFLQLQDSRYWNDEQVGANTPNGYGFFEDDLDFRQAYADIILPLGKHRSITLRIGRQELIYGNERLIGGFNWNNVAQTFDGVNMILKWNRLQLDTFLVRKVLIDTDAWNDWDENDTLFGTYLQTKIQAHKIEAYYLFRDTTSTNTGTAPTNSNLDESTIGLRLVGKKIGGIKDKNGKPQSGLNYTLEMAYQFGKAGFAQARENIEAFAFIAMIGYTLPHKLKPTFGVEINYGSGDRSPNKGTVRTFDNLFPTNHKFYGFFDLASLRNLVDIVLHFKMKPSKKSFLRIDLHFLNLANSRDFFYTAGRAPRAFTGSTTGPEDVGIELDIVGNYKFSPNFSLQAGFSQFWVGDYLKKAIGRKDNGEFFYIQSTLKI